MSEELRRAVETEQWENEEEVWDDDYDPNEYRESYQDYISSYIY